MILSLKSCSTDISVLYSQLALTLPVLYQCCCCRPRTQMQKFQEPARFLVVWLSNCNADRQIHRKCMYGRVYSDKVPYGGRNQSKVNVTMSKNYTLGSKRHGGAVCAPMLCLLNRMEMKMY